MHLLPLLLPLSGCDAVLSAGRTELRHTHCRAQCKAGLLLSEPKGGASQFNHRMTQAFKPTLRLDELSLAPTRGRAHRRGADPLRCWPHEYESSTENTAWTGAFHWNDVPGYSKGPKRDVGLQPYTLNYTFEAMFDHIPCGTKPGDRTVLLFDAHNSRQYDAKKRNYYAALNFINQYPSHHTLEKILGVSSGLFYEQVVPTIFSMADHMSFLDLNLRLWEYNHTEAFPERVTRSYDGFPLYISAPGNSFIQRLMWSGKYNSYCTKGEYGIALGAGVPIDYKGLHLGVRHDARIWSENTARLRKLYCREYGLGDKAYIGSPEMITEFKGRNLTPSQKAWNLLVQHYRGRTEHAIATLKARATLNTTWRGNYFTLAAITKVAAHMVGLEERMKGPRYNVYGPWPMAPDEVVLAFQR